MNPRLGHVDAVLTGRAVAFTRPGTRSAIAKVVRPGDVAVDVYGLHGDEHGDVRFHGGPEKAVHVYAREHYRRWTEELGSLAVLEAPGAFGENLSTTGLTEEDVCLGDEWLVGTAILAVSQSRQPCWKLNDRLGVADMARRVQQTGRTGWYCRVLRSGSLAAGNGIELVARPHAAWSLRRLIDLLYHGGGDVPELQQALLLPLVPSWRQLLERRLATGSIEDWRARTEGP